MGVKKMTKEEVRKASNEILKRRREAQGTIQAKRDWEDRKQKLAKSLSRMHKKNLTDPKTLSKAPLSDFNRGDSNSSVSNLQYNLRAVLSALEDFCR